MYFDINEKYIFQINLEKSATDLHLKISVMFSE